MNGLALSRQVVKIAITNVGSLIGQKILDEFGEHRLGVFSNCTSDFAISSADVERLQADGRWQRADVRR